MNEPKKRPRPKPGSLSLKLPESKPEDVDPPILAARNALAPWQSEHEPARNEAERAKTVTKLRAARRKAEELGAVVRQDAFDDWVKRCVKAAERPDEWTQARDLYESYLKHVVRFGHSRTARGHSKEEAATETRFGKMMRSLFTARRRSRGYFYPLRLKKGAD